MGVHRHGLASIRYGKVARDRSAMTPKWSDSSRPSQMLLITSSDSTAKSSLEAMWSMLLRPWKASAEVTIVMLDGKAL